MKPFYKAVHDAAIAGARASRIPSRLLGPPKGVATDMQVWVQAYLRRHPQNTPICWYKMLEAAMVVDRPFPRGLAATPPPFLEAQRTNQPELFVAALPRARVLMRTGLVVSDDDQLFLQSDSWSERFFPSDVEWNSLRPLLKPVKLPGSYLTIVSRMASNYFHWTTEALTRLCLAEKLPDVPVLLPKGLRPWQRDSLLALGVEKDRMCELEEGCYEVEQLYFPSFAGHTGNAAASLLSRLREKLCGQQRPAEGKRLYVSRGAGVKRRVLNEHEVVRALEPYGFTAIDGQRLSFAEQVRLFSDAEVVIGPHGAGLTNIIFAPEGCVVIEIVDPEYAIACYYAHAANLGHRFWFVLAENQTVAAGGEPRRHHDDITVPVNSVLETLESALAEAAALTTQEDGVSGTV